MGKVKLSYLNTQNPSLPSHEAEYDQTRDGVLKDMEVLKSEYRDYRSNSVYRLNGDIYIDIYVNFVKIVGAYENKTGE